MTLSDCHTRLVGRPCDVGRFPKYSSAADGVNLQADDVAGAELDTGTMRLDDDVSRVVSTLADGLA